jgi:amidase
MTSKLILLAAGIAASATALAQPASTAVKQTRDAIARIERLNPRINAVTAIDPTALDQARALDRAPTRGRLGGMPILIKDNIESKGPLPTTAGSLALANNVTDRDAPLVARLRASGAVIVGKTNLSEWANIRSNNSISGGARSRGRCATPRANRNACGSRGSGARWRRVWSGGDRHRNDGFDHLPAASQRHRRLQAHVGLGPRTHVIPISHSQDTPGR